MESEAHRILAYELALEDIQKEIESMVLERLLTITQGDLVYGRIVKLRNQCRSAFRMGEYLVDPELAVGKK